MTDAGRLLAGRTALVTGVSRAAGIGAAIARALAGAGANIFITYYRPFDALMPYGSRPEEASTILDEIRRQNPGAAPGSLEIDLSDPQAPAAVFDAAEAALGPVDILVNNAAFDIEVDIYGLSAALLDQHYAVNVRATSLLCVEFARRHTGRPGGRIINLTSGQGLGPMPDNLPYAVTKGGVDALTVSLSPALARKGITVNAIDPGPTDTGWMTAELKDQLEAGAPFGRVGQPFDAANLAVFLASDAAGWITGQIIRSRGGL